MEIHKESLEEEATHATDEARMVLPGVQALMGFQLIAVFNQRFESMSSASQLLHLAAFSMVVLAMGLIMAPAAYHRQAERGCVTRRFVDFTSRMLSLSLLPLIAGIALDTYVLITLISRMTALAIGGAALVVGVLGWLWFGIPALARADLHKD